jgi:hypothetical protein
MNFVRTQVCILFAVLSLFVSIGCGGTTNTPSSGSGAGTGTTGTTPSVDPSVIAADIQAGTALALEIGLPLLPSQTAVVADAKIALISVNAILQILNGSDQAAISDLLSQLLAGKITSLNTSPLIQSAIQLVLPLIINNLPSGLTSAATNIPPTVKLYMVAFFTGAQTGLTAYIPPTTGTAKALTRDVVPAQIKAGNAVLDVASLKTQFAAIGK